MTQAVLLARETTHGTIGTTFFSVPCNFDAELKQTNRVIDESRNGQDINFAAVQGRRHNTFDVKDSMVYHDTIGFWLHSVFGLPVSTVVDAAATWSSVYKFQDDPPSLSAKWAQPRIATTGLQALNMNVDTFGLKFDADGDLTYSASGVAFGETVIAAPTYSFSTVRPIAEWSGAVTLEGSGAGLYANLRSGSVTIKRNRKPYPTIRNNQDPASISIGNRTVEYDLTIRFADTVSYLRFKNGTTDALTVKFSDNVLIGAVAYPELSIKLGTINHESAKIMTEADLPELQLKGKATYNVTDASLAVATVVSTRQYQTA